MKIVSIVVKENHTKEGALDCQKIRPHMIKVPVTPKGLIMISKMKRLYLNGIAHIFIACLTMNKRIVIIIKSLIIMKQYTKIQICISER